MEWLEAFQGVDVEQCGSPVAPHDGLGIFTYNYDQDGITSRYNKFNILWWKKRNEAFEYTKFLSKKLKLNFYRGPDYYITKIINLYFSIFYKSYH